MENDVQNISPSQAQALAKEVARTHVLAMLQEQQAWIDSGRPIQTYILIKINLYTKSTS